MSDPSRIPFSSIGLVDDYSWFNLDALEGFADDVAGMFNENAFEGAYFLHQALD